MKYLQTYEKYKLSNRFGDKINKIKFNLLLNKYCKNYKNQNVKLYKGVPKSLSKFYYQNPKGHIRHSIEPQNIHVVIMSESDNWKEFPPYNQSVIASTNKKDAYEYGWGDGTLFEIIPYDNTKIGVCSSINIWSVFGGFSNDNTIKIVDYFLINYLEVYDDDWGDIQDEIEKQNFKERIDLIYKKDKFEFNNHVLPFIDEIKNYYNKKEDDITAKDIINFIEYLFDPERNGFEMFNYDSSFSENMENLYEQLSTSKLQVWCEGPVLLKKIEKKIEK